jgi:geranylgeranyl diphosphate synthase type II
LNDLARITQGLTAAIEPGEGAGCPPGLAAAIRYAIFPGGARVRPRLCLAVAHACGDDKPAIADAAAASIELLHCASLIHDDMPCFDNAPFRRGKPTVHVAFGERLALLAGDAMIVLAFESLADACKSAPERLPALLRLVARGVGTSGGIVAGQAWECESTASLAVYQLAKTGALFAAATMAGAAAAGVRNAESWGVLGAKIGEAFQVADDILDVVGNPATIGKPTGRDAELGRPSAVDELGMAGAVHCLKQRVAEAVASIPECPGADALRVVILAQAQSLLPSDMLRAA